MDNQAFLSYDCEAALVAGAGQGAEQGAGDTYLLSMCMTGAGPAAAPPLQRCGEFWFLAPAAAAELDTGRAEHVVALLVDKEQYLTQSEVSLCRTVLYCTVLYCNLLYCAILYCR